MADDKHHVQASSGLLSVKELTQALSISRDKVATLRAQGMPWHDLAGTVRFDLAEVLSWSRRRAKRAGK